MMNKKFISLMSATAIAASMFSAFSMTVNAADEVLYSNNFNGYISGKPLAVAHGTRQGWQTEADKGNQTFKDLLTTPAQYNLKNEKGNGLLINCEEWDSENIGDDTSAVYAVLKEASSDDNYITIPKCRFPGRVGNMALEGFDDYKAATGEDLVVSFKTMMTTGIDNSTGAVVNPNLIVGNIGSITVSENVPAGQWVEVRVVIPATGDSAMYIDDSKVASVQDGSLSLGLQSEQFEKEVKCKSYANVGIDDIVIMSVAAGTGSTVEIPEADTVAPAPVETPAPPTSVPTPEPLEDKVTFDFESDNSSLAVPTGNKFTAAVVESTNGTKALEVAATSDNVKSYANAAIDVSEYTKGKSHVKISYDSYMPLAGRMIISMLENEPATYYDGGVFSQGVSSEKQYKIMGTANASAADAWITTVVDVDFNTGVGTYTVSKAEEQIATGTIKTTLKAINTINFLSWSPNTGYIDNIVIETGGTLGVDMVTPEEPSKVAGSGISLVPDGAEAIDTYAATDTKEILNHAAAGVATTTDATEISAYSSSARGYSIYAAYDIYLEPESTFSITPYGNNGKAQASTMKLTSDNRGEVVVSAIVDGDKTVTADETLVYGTWYRVVVEIPQAGTSESTTTGELTYTIYRIDPENPAKVTEIAAQLTGLSARGIATRGVTSVGFTTTGTAYIDNVATFRAKGGYNPAPVTWYVYTATYGEGNVLNSIKVEQVDDPSTVVKSTDENTKTFIWNDKMVPYVSE